MLKIIQSYTLTQYINKGAYGKVYKAINHDTQQNVAIKMISLQKFTQNPKLIQLTKQQVQILSIVENNSNIIRLKQIIKSNRFLYMVYEYCQGGTLQEYLSKISGNNNSRLTEKQAILIFRQLINAYKSLYENNIVHRDIKTDNIFFKDGKLKLADFGFSKRLKYPDDLMQTSLGSPLYMAPEVLNNDVYGSKADLWSCGVILYQMLFNRVPYSTCNIKQLLEHYSNKSQPVIPIPYTISISPTILKMLQRILTKDQFRRISWQQFLYQYQFNDNGQVIHRQRDFQFDLMKLMKRNSSQKSCQGKDNVTECKSIGSIGSTSNKVKRFDWGKLTEVDLSSSVHSEECMQQQQQQSQQRLRLSSPCFNQITNNNHYLQQQQNKTILSSYSSSKLIQSPYFANYPNNNTNPNHSTHYLSQQNIPLQQQSQQTNHKIITMYNIKKSIKHFQQQHTKILSVLLILQQILQSNKQYICDLRVCYFIAYNLQWLLEKNVKEIKQYIKTNHQLLEQLKLQQQHKKLQKLQRIFVTQLQANRTKINSTKILLLTVKDLQLGLEVFQYPKKKEVMKRVMKKYVQLYEVENQGILDVIVNKSNSENSGKNDDNNNISVDRGQQIRLLRVLWAVKLVQQQQQNDNNNGNNKNNINNKINDINTNININNKTTINKKPLSFNPYCSLSIKQQTTPQQLSVLINRYLIELKI